MVTVYAVGTLVSKAVFEITLYSLDSETSFSLSHQLLIGNLIKEMLVSTNKQPRVT